jgi:hypothetical protein
MQPTPPLGARLLPLVSFGIVVAMVRYALEFAAPAHTMWFGVYFAMPLAFLAIGMRGSWGAIRWPALFGTMLLIVLFVWTIPNTIAYTTGQFLEWNHGRFYHGGPDDPNTRAAAIAESFLGKVGLGALQGLLTSIGGIVWCTVGGTLLIWLPGRLRRRASAQAAS